MRFTWKLLLITLLGLALAVSGTGTVFILQGHDQALEREKAAALTAHRSFCYTLQTAAAALPADENIAVREIQKICQDFEGIQYLSQEGTALLDTRTSPETDWYQLPCCQRLHSEEDGYVLQTASTWNSLGDTWHMDTVWDVTPLFQLRHIRFRNLQMAMGILLVLGLLTMGWVARSVNRPIRKLTLEARRITETGAPSQSIKMRRGELGALEDSFHAMVATMEDKMHALEQTARQKEDFVGSFAHELKTPLTSMIGYADMLRSQQLEPEKAFRAANYIFTEGRRLEALSLKLLELTILRHQDFSFKWVSTTWLIEGIQGFLTPAMEQYGLAFTSQVEEASIYIDADLIKTLLMNLIDNARKASEPGKNIQIIGEKTEDGYRITIADHGRGIPQKELSRITEAFYMVDKSRARAMNGAGLGLALCQQIAQVHKSSLHFTSQEGQGTQVSLVLQMAQRQRRSRRGGIR